ncbi:alpha/beta fold hydrolase [Streptomyces sp. NPDC051322]|uniref:thioesterase II family protein n=1 Tax=Streptomyces sp. NPDC051322 TaxID=3154645 RepID=UPI00344E985B
MSASEIWFRRYARQSTPRLRLVGFPHAGGNAQLFHGWPARLPADIELLAVRYPGRQERLSEPCIESMDELVGEITEALTPYRDMPVAFFGHSMGAAVAYEAAARLEAGTGAGPATVMLSGRNAPHRTSRTQLHRAADEVLIAGVGRLGTLGGDAYGIPELRDLLLPALRSDYKLIETYQPEKPVRLRAPIIAYRGDRDPGCDQQRVLAWEELTSGGFTLRSFTGDHFYIAPREAELTADIAERLAHVPARQTI